MADSDHPHPSPSRIRDLCATVQAATGIHPDIIRGSSRKRQAVSARRMVWRALREEGFGFSPIAHVWGCDHTTIMHAERQGWAEPYAGTGRWGRGVLDGGGAPSPV